jgi:DNA-binding PucR family transcriptional regulator
MPELVTDAPSHEIAGAVVRANIEAFALVLERDLPREAIEVPGLSIKLAREQAWAGVGIDEIVRAYRLGQEWLWDELVDCAREHVADPRALAAVVTQVGAASFRYIDVVCTRIAAAYATEAETIARSAGERRAGLVQAVLAGHAIDATEVEKTLAYRFDGPHVAFLVWGAGTSSQQAGSSSVDDVVKGLTSLLESRHPLFVREGPDLMAGWITVTDEVPSDAIAELLAGTTVTVSAGTPRRGFEGFRETRREADRARAVALATSMDGRFVSYDEVALLSLLLADVEAARAFATAELGALARDDNASATLRRTVLTLLRLGGPLEAAEALLVHRNTVAHRVHRAEELRGRPLSERRQEVEAALLICEWLGRRALARS